jgi:hypothetical protein
LVIALCKHLGWGIRGYVEVTKKGESNA